MKKNDVTTAVVWQSSLEQGTENVMFQKRLVLNFYFQVFRLVFLIHRVLLLFFFFLTDFVFINALSRYWDFKA